MLDDLSARLAENLRRLREARGLTQQDLSVASGVPRPTLAHLESGSANPTLSVIARVAHALSVPMEELVAKASATLEVRPAKTLPRHERSGARVTDVCPEPPNGIVVERIELGQRAELARDGSRQADRIYVVCERGEIEVGSGDERCALRAGDLALVRRGAAHVLSQRGRSAAVAYSVRIGAWPG
ncbi:MAG: XRE family transcriptional regulator [Polyangiaceae bacterium]